MYREQLHRPFFSQKIKKLDDGKKSGGADKSEFPLLLRWGGAQDAEGLEVPVNLTKTPVQFELHFPGPLEPLNMLIEFNGWHFYKAPGTKLVDLMPYFFDSKNAVKKSETFKLRYFLPPADGMNRPQNLKTDGKAVAAGDPYTAKDGDWLYNYYAELPGLPKIVVNEKAICIKTSSCLK